MKRTRGTGESGQVLAAGVFMLLALLLALLLIFDVHNIIRAKLKVETATQAAALAGAEWQVKTLNMIGELNLIKACGTLLEDSPVWGNSAGTAAARSEMLSEMQMRAAFLGPLTGFAAAQQAAKMNGMPAQYDAAGYIEGLKLAAQYNRSGDTANRYKWEKPYLETLSAISSGGLAVLPNINTGSLPDIRPPQLASMSLYREIELHRREIAAGKTAGQSGWRGTVYPFVTKWNDEDFKGRFWSMSSALNGKSINQSDIYSPGIGYSGSAAEYSVSRRTIGSLLREPYQPYADRDLPDGLRFAVYDPDVWDAEISDEGWFDGSILRGAVKERYRYTGPFAYAESGVKTGTVGNFTASRSGIPASGGREIQIGGGIDSDSETERPGAVAKPLGGLSGDLPPNAVPLVLPVFKSAALIPTFMPPRLHVMNTDNAPLLRFLNWLDKQDSLWVYSAPPPAGTEVYLDALRTLADGKGFRYYGWNPGFNAERFDAMYRRRVSELFGNAEICYSGDNPAGAGWLQQPQLFTAAAGDGKKTSAKVRDYVNGGTAVRYFKGGHYIVTDSRGHIVTNDEIDPTVVYDISGGNGPPGRGFGGTVRGADTKELPRRL